MIDSSVEEPHLIKGEQRIGGADVVFRPYEKSRGIRLVRSLFSPLLVTYPPSMPQQILRDGLLADQLFRNAVRIAKNPIANPLLDGRVLNKRVLRILPKTSGSVSWEPTRSGYIVEYPDRLHIESYPVQRVAYDCFKKMAYKEAKERIPEMVAEEAERLGLTYGSVRIKDMETRWGSCSSKRNLNFSLYLLFYGEKATRYTVLHELAHLTHMNHGEQFWRLLSDYLGGDARRIDWEVSRVQPNIPALF